MKEQAALLAGLDGWGLLLCSAYLVGLILVLLHLENLYRCAIPPVRHRLRPLVLGVFVAFGCQIAAISYTLLFRVIHPSHFLVSAAGFLGGQVLIAFALVRHRLLDSDVYVSRYVVYRSLTLALAGGYLFSLGLVAEILQLIGISLDFLTVTLLVVAGGCRSCTPAALGKCPLEGQELHPGPFLPAQIRLQGRVDGVHASPLPRNHCS